MNPFSQLIIALAAGSPSQIASVASKTEDFDAFLHSFFQYLDSLKNDESAAQTFCNLTSRWPDNSSHQTFANLLTPYLESFSTGSKNCDFLKSYVATFREMLKFGWNPKEQTLHNLLISQSSYFTSGFLDEMIQYDVFPKNFLDDPYNFERFNRMIALPDCDSVAVLKYMKSKNWLSPSSPIITPSDLLLQGNFDGAKFLFDSGHPLGMTRRNNRHHAASGPFMALCFFIGEQAFRDGENNDASIKSHNERAMKNIISSMDWLKTIEGGLSCETKHWGLPYSVVLNHRANCDMLDFYAPIVKKMIDIGFSPNAFDHDLLLHGLSQETSQGGIGSRKVTEFSLSVGAHASGVAGRAISALMTWQYDEGDVIDRIEEIRKDSRFRLDLSEIAADCPLRENPFASAVEAQKYRVASYVRTLGVPCTWSYEGASPLHLLARRSSKEPLALLASILDEEGFRLFINDVSLNRGIADFEKIFGMTPLMIACYNQNFLAAEILLKAGADPNVVGADGMTAMHHLSRKYGEKSKVKMLPLLELLLDKGADFKLRDDKGRTPLQLMVKKSPLPAIARLVALSADDVVGSDKAAKKAKKDLLSREDGDEAHSIVENVVFKKDALPSSVGSKRKRL